MGITNLDVQHRGRAALKLVGISKQYQATKLKKAKEELRRVKRLAEREREKHAKCIARANELLAQAGKHIEALEDELADARGE